MLPRELLTGTSFALTGEVGGAGSGTVSLWGRGAVSRFDGREGELTLSGEVTSAMLGADWMGGPGSGSGAGAWTVGLLVSHSRGEGSYRGVDAGTVGSTLTGLYPYGRYEIGPRLSVWGVAGYGAGSLTLAPDGRPAIETDMDLAMGAAGVRGVAVEAPAEGGVEVAITSDAMAVRTASEKTAGLAGAEAEVTRLRLGLEGVWRGLEAGGGELVPRLEVGVRHDGGDAETGFGLDVGGGLSWSHPASGLSAELSGRGLLTHESRGFPRPRPLGVVRLGSGPGHGPGPEGHADPDGGDLGVGRHGRAAPAQDAGRSCGQRQWRRRSGEPPAGAPDGLRLRRLRRPLHLDAGARSRARPGADGR